MHWTTTVFLEVPASEAQAKECSVALDRHDGSAHIARMRNNEFSCMIGLLPYSLDGENSRLGLEIFT